jgi:hypothetical protein
MLYDSKLAKKKMHLAYKGPFVIISLRGVYSKLYYLRQVNSIAILKSFYSDHLKPFKLQTSYLVTGYKQQLPMY